MPNKKEKTISGKQRREATNKILRSTLRLLVLLRESLGAQQVPRDNPLHQSVYIHANLVASLLPHDELISPEELDNIRASVGSVPTTEADGIIEPAKPTLTQLVKRVVGGKSDIIVLNPDLSRNTEGE